MIDLYCERLSPGFWAEPVNALTNAGFVLAAWFIWRYAARIQFQSPAVALLCVVIAIIGIGSFLFHTMATSLTQWMDIIPILVFQLLFIWLYLTRVQTLHKAMAAIFLAIFLVAALYGRQFPGVLNGSLIYAPAFLVILAMGFLHFLQRREGRFYLLSAAAVFMLSLFFRSIDNGICDDFELGTHFMWHILNAGVLYLSMRALIPNLVHRGLK